MSNSEHFQNVLREHNLPPETTKAQFVWHATKHGLKMGAWGLLIMSGISLVMLWHFAPEMVFQILGVPYVALSVAAPILIAAGAIYLGHLLVKVLKRAARD
jgi:hypothetical protein